MGPELVKTFLSVRINFSYSILWKVVRSTFQAIMNLLVPFFWYIFIFADSLVVSKWSPWPQRHVSPHATSRQSPCGGYSKLKITLTLQLYTTIYKKHDLRMPLSGLTHTCVEIKRKKKRKCLNTTIYKKTRLYTTIYKKTRLTDAIIRTHSHMRGNKNKK